MPYNTKEKKNKYMRRRRRKYYSIEENAIKRRAYVKKSAKKMGYKGKYKKRCNVSEYREAIIHFLIDRDGLNCFYCGLPLINPEIGHNLAFVLGGKHRLDNYILCHAECNNKDSVKIMRVALVNKDTGY